MFQLQQISKLANGPEQIRLVVGSFDKKLQLRVLVGDAEGRCRCLATMHLSALAVRFLSSTLTPELFEPEGKFPKRLGIWKQHQNIFPALAVQNELRKRGDQR